MNNSFQAYATYWRNSLLDSEHGSGVPQVGKTDNFLHMTLNELQDGRVEHSKIVALFANESDQLQTIEVIVRPKVYLPRLEHAQRPRTGIPDVVTPLLITAKLNRDGRLLPASMTIVPRDLLEPLDRSAFAIGAFTDMDVFLTKYPAPGCKSSPIEHYDDNLWLQCLDHAERLFEYVGKGWPAADDRFEVADYWYLSKKDSASGASAHILDLYDHLRENAPISPLFERYASNQVAPPEACLPPGAAFTARMGHAGDAFPLAQAQRDAMTHLLKAHHGDILAVNGPPGTGKTTMLLSVVASLWASATLDDNGEPPVIVAASTNNQAVTNIIDAFGKDFALGSGPFAGRWLPDVRSFGAYFPAQSKETESAAKYQTRAFFDKVETPEYVEHAKNIYLQAAAAAFPEITKPNLADVIKALRGSIRAELDKLATLDDVWQQLTAARETVMRELGESPAAAMTEYKQQEAELEAQWQACNTLAEQWEVYLAKESILYSLFSWLPPVADKRLRLARLFLKERLPDEPALHGGNSINEIETDIQAWREQFAAALKAQRQRVQRGEAILEAEQTQMERWRAALTPLGVTERAESLSLEECDVLADTAIRFPIFLLTTHYWEGRWLLEMESLLPELEKKKRKTGRVTVEQRWRRRMKLTPCVVSTFFMLPLEMRVKRFVANKFAPDYLYDFIDLLIVDEAGQVLPEVAGASFALAKKALIIGDTLQIEPIWSIPPQVDIGNMISAGIIDGTDPERAYEQLTELGKTAASGSVMRIAQNASRYHYDPDLARGMFLYEHRRCFDEIIGYCNELCYHNKLLPKRGSRLTNDGLPTMGYLHVDGICQSSNGGSRQNLLEADTIAAWLDEHKAELEIRYAKPLSQIVGVVTPFGGQVKAIQKSCQSRGLEAGGKEGMTVGTVHSLQGAERSIVIFSPVYTKHADGEFIDRSPSMLNVAVSRAKDSFLVFGDMDVLELSSKSRPRGLLSTYLCRKPSNALNFKAQQRTDLTTQQIKIIQLLDAQAHDAFLLDTLTKAVREVQIVSPWLQLRRIEQIGALEAMRAAAERGVRVCIYTDPEWNIDAQDSDLTAEKSLQLQTAVETLQENGIETAFVRRVHSKLLLADDELYCAGSFNWFSASRDSRYARHETSLAYSGPEIAKEIEVVRKSLNCRLISHNEITSLPKT